MQNCRLAEVLQYMCSLERQKRSQKYQIVCTQVPRIFQLCPGQPAVEVTRVANIDMVTGEVDVPQEAAQIKAKEWVDITRYPTSDAE